MLKVKLSQRGKKHQRSFRIIIAEAKSKRDGKFIDDLGWWNPKQKKGTLDQKKLKSWQEKGAQLTSGLKKVIEQINSSK